MKFRLSSGAAAATGAVLPRRVAGVAARRGFSVGATAFASADAGILRSAGRGTGNGAAISREVINGKEAGWSVAAASPPWGWRDIGADDGRLAVCIGSTIAGMRAALRGACSAKVSGVAPIVTRASSRAL